MVVTDWNYNLHLRKSLLDEFANSDRFNDHDYLSFSANDTRRQPVLRYIDRQRRELCRYEYGKQRLWYLLVLDS